MSLKHRNWQTVPHNSDARRFSHGLSVFFPAFNDALSLPSLLARMVDTLRRVAADYEIIVVNDGSTDNTAEVLEDLRRKYSPWLRVLTHPNNQGYGAALRSGFAAATKEFIFYTDGDGQYDPAELELLLTKVTPETGLVNGYKIERNDPWHRVAIGSLYNWFARRLFRIRLRDIDCDFRLIRRDALDPSRLKSTGGTICVEIVRSLELSGSGVVEVPVHHYPRTYGRSQFFRVQSLANTFVQLCALFFRLVAIPALTGARARSHGAHPAARGEFTFSPRTVTLMVLSVTALSFLTYGRSLRLPFISDDYIQIQLGRDYGPLSGWSTLFQDALYRCRATSIVLTYWTERAFGLNPFVFNLSSLLLHIVNSLMVFALGLWRPIGWRVSAVAACFFAVSQRHSEAVVWYAAAPELLVFLFSIASFLCWVHWIQSRSHEIAAYTGALFFWVLALLSKESAVALVPLCAVAVLAGENRDLKRLWGLAPFVLGTGFYFTLAALARENHLHFNDGTFSLSAPFWAVVARSTGGLLWIWGLVSIIILAVLKASKWRRLMWIAGAWILVTLLPYSFLTYMTSVPSRHTYFASAGIALIVGAAALTLREWSLAHKRSWMPTLAAAIVILHQSGYVWTVKHHQYARRAAPTEALIRAAARSTGPVYASCFPYSHLVAEGALKLRHIEAVFITGPAARNHAEAIDFCNEVAYE